MPGCSKGENDPVRGDKGDIQNPGRGNNQPIGRIGMKFAGQTHTVDRNHGFDGYQMNSRQGQCDIDPEPDVMTKPQPPLLHEQGDFPGRDRRNRNPVCLGCLFYEGPRRLPESLVIGNCPDQNMGVEDDHCILMLSFLDCICVLFCLYFIVL